MKHWRIGLLGVVVTALAIYFIVTQVNLSQFREAWARARYIYVMPCVAFLLLGLVTRAARWRVLLSGGLPLSRAFSIMNVAYLVNGVLPLRVGEAARLYLASQAEPPVPAFKTASTIIVERLLDLLAVVALLGLALTGGRLPDELRAAGLVTAPAALIGFLALVFLARRRALSQRLMALLVAHVGFLQSLRLATWLDHFLDGLAPLTRLNTLVQTLAWTALSWGFSAIAGYILMFALYEQADAAATALYIAAAAFAIAVPAVPGNIGPYEASILLALGAMGYGQDGAALAFAVIVHGVNLAVHATTGVVGFIQEGITLEQLSQGMRRIQQNAN